MVRALIDDLGFDTVDSGSLDDSWRQQPGTPVYGLREGVDGIVKGAGGGLAGADGRLQGLREFPYGLRDHQASLAHFCRAALVVKSATSLSCGCEVYWWNFQSALMRGLPAVT